MEEGLGRLHEPHALAAAAADVWSLSGNDSTRFYVWQSVTKVTLHFLASHFFLHHLFRLLQFFFTVNFFWMLSLCHLMTNLKLPQC